MSYDLTELQNNVDRLISNGKYDDAVRLLKKEADSILKNKLKK